MRAHVVVWCIAAVFGTVSVASAETVKSAADPIARGKAIAEANCHRCHAIGLDDMSAHAKAPPFREVVKRYPTENLAEALAEGIVSGHPDMPVFVFNPSQIEDFLAYLRTLEAAGPGLTRPD